jgi:branched-chain amino acid transport system permease protein
MFSRVTACLALMLAIAGCARLTGQDQISLCGAALALIEDETVHIKNIRTDTATHAILIEYTLTNGSSATDRQITCAFSGSGFSKGRMDLTSIETGNVKLGEASLIFLKRLIERNERETVLENGTNTPLYEIAPEFRPLAYGLQVFIDAFPRASLYALLAASFSLICGLIGRMMFGIGEVTLMGAAAAFLFLAHLVDTDFNSFLLGSLALLCVAIWTGIIFGITATRHIVEPLLGKSPHHLLIASCGLMIAIPEFVRLTQGNGFRSIIPSYTVPFPFLAADGFIVVVNPIGIIVSLIAMILVVGIVFVTKFTRFGRNRFACADDPDLAELIGINRKALLIQTSALSVAIAGASGALVVLLYGGPNYATGTMLGIKAIMAGLIGRTHSVTASIIAGYVIGLTEAGLAIFLESQTLDPTIYAVLAAALILRARR